MLELLLTFESRVVSLDAQLKGYEINLERDKAEDERERRNAERALEIEKEATNLKAEEARMEKARGDLYEKLLKEATKRNGIGCFFKRLFTFGTARCG